MKIGTLKETSYGLKFIVITIDEWKQLKPATYETNWYDYDRMIVEMQIKNCGYGILDATYYTPIDNEYDLAEIYNMMEDKK